MAKQYAFIQFVKDKLLEYSQAGDVDPLSAFVFSALCTRARNQMSPLHPEALRSQMRLFGLTPSELYLLGKDPLMVLNGQIQDKTLLNLTSRYFSEGYHAIAHSVDPSKQLNFEHRFSLLLSEIETKSPFRLFDSPFTLDPVALWNEGTLYAENLKTLLNPPLPAPPSPFPKLKIKSSEIQSITKATSKPISQLKTPKITDKPNDKSLSNLRSSTSRWFGLFSFLAGISAGIPLTFQGLITNSILGWTGGLFLISAGFLIEVMFNQQQTPESVEALVPKYQSRIQ